MGNLASLVKSTKKARYYKVIFNLRAKFLSLATALNHKDHKARYMG